MVLVDLKNMRSRKVTSSKHNSSFEWDIIHEEGREIISKWRDKRLAVKGARKAYHEFLVHSFDLDTLRNFFQNINFMVVIQMVLALIAVYMFQTFNISFDVHIGLFVSPIVFPLAFSINTDFQRREKVLEDLAVFKSSGMVWYFCMREWKQAAKLNNDWITAVHGKLKSLLFHLREYLLTCKPERRKIILRAMYEDFSDTNQLIEKVRASELPSNTAVISRSIHLLNMMCLSFERLRVVREYRSPRSIRSFNKVFIMFLPIILAPYFVYLGIKSNNVWEPYYIAVLVAFVFSALQGVQDKLDDPFDGMSEDDIDLDTIDEWTFGSLEHTMKRTFDIGRFKVTVETDKDPKSPIVSCMCSNETIKRKSSLTRPLCRPTAQEDHPDIQKMAPYLEGISGNERITRKSLYRKSSQIDAETSQPNLTDAPLNTIFEPINIENVTNFEGQTDKKVTFDKNLISPNSESLSFMSYEDENDDQVQVASYLLRTSSTSSPSNQLTVNDQIKTKMISTSSNGSLNGLEKPKPVIQSNPVLSNRFMIKSSDTAKSDIPSLSPETNIMNPVKKKDVLSVDKLKDIIIPHDAKMDNDLEKESYYTENLSNLSTDYDKAFLLESSNNSHHESINIPSVSFRASTNNGLENSKNRGLLNSLSKDGKNNYSSIPSVEDDGEELQKKISSAL